MEWNYENVYNSLFHRVEQRDVASTPLTSTVTTTALTRTCL